MAFMSLESILGVREGYQRNDNESHNHGDSTCIDGDAI